MAVEKKKDAIPEEQVILRVPRSIRKRVRQLAADEDRSIQDMARILLDEALKKHGA